MSSQTRLSRAYKEAKRIPFNNTDKFILFSDCHRGDSSFADDFANNRNIYFHAVNSRLSLFLKKNVVTFIKTIFQMPFWLHYNQFQKSNPF